MLHIYKSFPRGKSGLLVSVMMYILYFKNPIFYIKEGEEDKDRKEEEEEERRRKKEEGGEGEDKKLPKMPRGSNLAVTKSEV